MFNKNWWFLNFQKEFLNFSFCICNLAVAFYMINGIQPKIKFQNIVQCPFNCNMLSWSTASSFCIDKYLQSLWKCEKYNLWIILESPPDGCDILCKKGLKHFAWLWVTYDLSWERLKSEWWAWQCWSGGGGDFSPNIFLPLTNDKSLKQFSIKMAKIATSCMLSVHFFHFLCPPPLKCSSPPKMFMLVPPLIFGTPASACTLNDCPLEFKEGSKTPGYKIINKYLMHEFITMEMIYTYNTNRPIKHCLNIVWPIIQRNKTTIIMWLVT